MKKLFTINSFIGGHSLSLYEKRRGEFLSSIAIDPQASVDPDDLVLLKPSGIIFPVRYEKFSGAGLSGAPMWIITNPKDNLLYIYASDGEFISYNNSLAGETVIGTPTSGAGNGMVYYNNYIYLVTPTNISRYGPLSGTPSLTNTVWTGATLGSQTALTNTTYPSIRNVTYPNHPMHPHVDGKLYFLDFINGQGMVHYIKTKKITDEGDTNDGSTYSALTNKLPFGYVPFGIASYGTDLAIIASRIGTSSDFIQGESALFLWDTFSSSIYRQVPIPATSFASAIKNVNGQLFIWGGTIDFGYQVFRYLGGYQLELVEDFQLSSPPFQGAVDAFGNRIVWGAYSSDPSEYAGLYAIGYQSPKLPSRALNSIARISNSTDTNPIVSAIKYVQQAQRNKRPIMGWRTTTSAAFGLDKVSPSATFNAVWRSEIVNVGRPFDVLRIRLNLSEAIAANMTITPKIYVDEGSSNTALETINNTNFAASERTIYLQTPVSGKHNFFLELTWGGTVDIYIVPPIEFELEVYE